MRRPLERESSAIIVLATTQVHDDDWELAQAPQAVSRRLPVAFPSIPRFDGDAVSRLSRKWLAEAEIPRRLEVELLNPLSKVSIRRKMRTGTTQIVMRNTLIQNDQQCSAISPRCESVQQNRNSHKNCVESCGTDRVGRLPATTRNAASDVPRP